VKTGYQDLKGCVFFLLMSRIFRLSVDENVTEKKFDYLHETRKEREDGPF